MRVAAAILAAGSSSRFGSDKTQLILRGMPLWRWSYNTFLAHPGVQEVGIVCPEKNLAAMASEAPEAAFVIAGGKTRQRSAQKALEHVAGKADILLLHDAARPFVGSETITRVLGGIARAGAAAPVVPVADTIREIDGLRLTLLDRNKLVAMQTPQGATVDLLNEAFSAGLEDQPDEMALIESIGHKPEYVDGEQTNFKITSPQDADRARALAGVGEIRTGIGYDVHQFVDDSTRTLVIGGVEFPDHRPLAGHSDADVLLHAIVDAILGAAALGDIGEHFPPSEAKWKNMRSGEFLRHAEGLIIASGWRILNIDATVVAESPRIMTRAAEIRRAISEELGLPADRISVKATTNERLGFIGRGEGIAAFAIATIQSA